MSLKEAIFVSDTSNGNLITIADNNCRFMAKDDRLLIDGERHNVV